MTRLQSLAALCALGAVGAGGCAGNLAERDATRYRDDARALLMSNAPRVKSCYDQALRSDPKVAGRVVVHFKVQPETGRVVEPHLDQGKSTAGAALGDCVLRAVDGLTLTPADANEGQATFAWDFRPRV